MIKSVRATLMKAKFSKVLNHGISNSYTGYSDYLVCGHTVECCRSNTQIVNDKHPPRRRCDACSIDAVKLEAELESLRKRYLPRTITELIGQLARPLYVYRMAKSVAMLGHPERSMVRSARTRLRNAELEIDRLVRSYCTSKEN